MKSFALSFPIGTDGRAVLLAWCRTPACASASVTVVGPVQPLFYKSKTQFWPSWRVRKWKKVRGASWQRDRRYEERLPKGFYWPVNVPAPSGIARG